MLKIQFVETSRTQRKFGVSVEHNTSEIASFCGAPISFPTMPGVEKQGDLKARIPTVRGEVLASVGDWICKDDNGNLSVVEAKTWTN